MSYEEQIMTKDKYRSMFWPQMEAIVFIILRIFFATRAVGISVLSIFHYYYYYCYYDYYDYYYYNYPLSSRDAFRPISRKQKMEVNRVNISITQLVD